MSIVLVTGATGFLGRHVLMALRQRGDVEIVAACRAPQRLPEWYRGEVRAGDLTDAEYRRTLVQGVDVVVHAGTWSSFWGHAGAERDLFLAPALDLIDRAVEAGVSRFVFASTVALSSPSRQGVAVADDAEPVKRGFWPHLDFMIDVDAHMRARAGSTQMVTMRLGHFVGRGNSTGVVSAIVPRLKTLMVPWVGGGRSRMPLVSGTDMGEAFALAATVPDLEPYTSLNVVGADQPTTRDVFTFVAGEAGVRAPFFSVPGPAAHAFAWLMEKLHPVLPGKAPFLTRSLVHVGQDWFMATDAARDTLGYVPRTPWREAARENIAERRALGFPWPALTQAVTRPGAGRSL